MSDLLDADTDDDLPFEVVDVTVNEQHEVLTRLLVSNLERWFAGRALVMGDTFIRVGREQYSPDVYVVPGASRGNRKVFRPDREGIPTVTIDVLSAANYDTGGSEALQRKRQFLGRLGVAEHIEVDQEQGFVTAWQSVGGSLVRFFLGTDYVSPGLEGVRIVTPAPHEVEVYDPDGQPFLTYAALAEVARRATLLAHAEGDRADEAAERARQASERAREASERAREADHQARLADERAHEADRKARDAVGSLAAMRAKLLAAGIDPDA